MAISTSHRMDNLVQSGRMGHLGGSLLAVAVMLLAAAAVLLGVDISRQQRMFNGVQECDQELIRIDEVERHLLAVELTVRGFALTDDPQFVAYYRNEVGQMQAALATLASDFADDPAPIRERFARLQELTRQRLDLFAGLMALGPGHAAAVADAIRDPHVRATMRAARSKLGELRQLELDELGDLQAKAERQVAWTYLQASVIVIGAFALGACGMVLLRLKQP